MIEDRDIVDAGYIIKPHGIQGEMSVGIELDQDPCVGQCLVIEIDGLRVPFFITSVRGRGTGSYLLRLDGIDSEEQAKSLAKKRVAFLAKDVDEDDEEEDDDDRVYLDSLIGYTMVDGDGNLIGTIGGVDDTTLNVLFLVDRADGSEAMVPAADEYIVEIDPEARTLTVDLPDGLL